MTIESRGQIPVLEDQGDLVSNEDRDAAQAAAQAQGLPGMGVPGAQTAPWMYGFDPTFSDLDNWIVRRTLPSAIEPISLHDNSYDALQDPANFVDRLLSGDLDDVTRMTANERSMFVALMTTPIGVLRDRFPEIEEELTKAGVDFSKTIPVPEGEEAVSPEARRLTAEEREEQAARWGEVGLTGRGPREPQLPNRPSVVEPNLTLTLADLYTEDRALQSIISKNEILKDNADIIMFGGEPLLDFQAWAAQRNLDEDATQTKMLYEAELLQQAWDVNSTKESPEDYIQFDWDPANPSRTPRVKRGDSLDPGFSVAMEDSIKPTVDPTTGQTIPAGNSLAFVAAYMPNTNTGQAAAQDIKTRLLEYGFGDLAAEQLGFMMSGMNPAAIPYLNGQQASSQAFGTDINALDPVALNEIADLAADTFGGDIGDGLRNLVNDSASDASLRPAVGVALQLLTQRDANAAAFITQEVDRFVGPEALGGIGFDLQITPQWGGIGEITGGTGRALPIPIGTPGAVRGGGGGGSVPYRGMPIPGTAPTPYSPGTQHLSYSGSQVNSWFDEMGGDPRAWANRDIVEHLVMAAESRGVPYQLVFAVMEAQTNGWTQFSSEAQAIGAINGVVNNLTQNMERYGNPLLALISTAFVDGEDVAQALQNTGMLDPMLASSVADAAGGLLQRATAYGYFQNPAMTMGLQALTNNAGMSSNQSIEIGTTDKAAVKEALRTAYEALLMPVSESALDSFASQFRSAEIAAQQPRVNAYNGAIESNREYWTSTVEGMEGSTKGVGTWVFPADSPDAHFSNSYGYDGGRSAKNYVHGGIDIHAPMGTAIRAPVGGKIIDVNYNTKVGGNTVWLEGDDGILYYFAHNQYNSVASGQRVAQGQKLGGVGDTGNAKGTKPHIHFEMHVNGRRNGQSMNPDASGRTNPYYRLMEARNSGMAVISDWDQRLGFNADLVSQSEALARAQTYEVSMPSLTARAIEASRETPLYKDLYKEKPVGLSDVEYGTAFAQRAAQLGGGATDVEAARVGAATNSIESMYGRMLTNEDQVEESTTFRGNLYRISNSFIAAMGGRQ